MGPFLLVHFAMTGNRKRQLHKARLARRRNAVPPIGPLVRFKAVFAFPMRFAEQRNNGRQAACNCAQSVWQPSKSIGRFLLRAKKQAAAGHCRARGAAQEARAAAPAVVPDGPPSQKAEAAFAGGAACGPRVAAGPNERATPDNRERPRARRSGSPRNAGDIHMRGPFGPHNR